MEDQKISPLIYTGLILSTLGLLGLILVILSSMSVRKLEKQVGSEVSEKLAERLSYISKIHIASIFCAFLGLVVLVAGLILD